MFQILQIVCKTQGRAGLANLCWDPRLKIGPARLMPKAGTAKRRSSLSPHYFKGVDEESHNKVAVPFFGQTCQIRSNTVQCLDGFSCPDVSHIVPCGLMNAAFPFLKEDAKHAHSRQVAPIEARFNSAPSLRSSMRGRARNAPCHKFPRRTAQAGSCSYDINQNKALKIHETINGLVGKFTGKPHI